MNGKKTNVKKRKNNDGFVLEKKTYDWRYLLLLPFQSAPAGTIIVIGQKLITGLSCVLLIWLEADFINQVVSGKAASYQTLLPYLLGMLAIIIWKRMGYNLGRAQTKLLTDKVNYQLQREVVKKCARVPYRLLENRTFQELKESLTTDVEGLIWSMLQQTGNFLNFLVRMAGVYAILLSQNVWLGLLAASLMIPVLYVSVRNEYKVQTVWWERKPYYVRLRYLSMLLAARGSIQERTLFSYTDYVNREWLDCYDGIQKANEKGTKQREGGAVTEGVVLNLVFVLVEIFMITLLADGEMSLGMFIALSVGIYDMQAFMYHGMDYTIMAMENGMFFLQKLTSFAAMPETEGTCELPSELVEELEELEFKSVSFRYPRTAQYILQDLNFTIQKGEHCAFVGENGTGKTTIAKILTGVYDNYEGSILVNGRELRTYELEKRKAMFAAIYQDSARYDETVAVNIGVGNSARLLQSEQPSEELRTQMEQAARRLGMYESIQKLPQGFDTFLGKQAGNGTELSDGQWQRIIMARLLINPAPFWILDEPAAALDPITESGLYEQFAQISQGKTTISISHRLGSTRQADRIYVLRDGTIAEQGSHEELMSRQGLYAKMYEGQKEWYR